MLKKQQKMIKISSKIVILMSEKKIFNTYKSRVFAKVRVKVVYPLKQGLKLVS